MKSQHHSTTVRVWGKVLRDSARSGERGAWHFALVDPDGVKHKIESWHDHAGAIRRDDVVEVEGTVRVIAYRVTVLNGPITGTGTNDTTIPTSLETDRDIPDF